MRSYQGNELDSSSSLNLAVNSFEDISILNWKQSKKYFEAIYIDYKILNINSDGFYRVFRESLKNLMP
jgi:hypothetical protein